MKPVFLFALAIPICAAARDFERLELEPRYFSEGAAFGDIDGDDRVDAVSGPHWWKGPDFTEKHTFYQTTPTDPNVPGYVQDQFLVFVSDVDQDGDNDIVVSEFPGKNTVWYEHTGDPAAADWPKHLMLTECGNEAPAFADLTGDGKPELICLHDAAYGYASPGPDGATKPWVFHAVSEPTGFNVYQHGLGVGDVNGDGRADLVVRDGWYERPAKVVSGELWSFHRFNLRPKRVTPNRGGGQMHVYDVDGDGDNDIVTSLDGHGYGLVWLSQEPGGVFVEHTVLSEKPDEGAVNFSQLHSMELADVDGDGLKDIIVGKCRYAHGPDADPDPKGEPVLYWFRLLRGGEGVVDWQPNLIDNASGSGRNFGVADVDADGKPDIVIGNKMGTILFY